MALLPYLEDLGVNAVELLPLFEFNGTRSWGYGSTHFLAIEKSAGGRDALKRFVKACHRRGIAVLTGGRTAETTSATGRRRCVRPATRSASSCRRAGSSCSAGSPESHES